MVALRSVGASCALVPALLVAGCGLPDQDSSGARAAAATTESAAPAVAPVGPTSYPIDYRCRSGREATITVDVPDLRDLARTLNGIQPCEYDRGFDRGVVMIACDSGPVTVALGSRDGAVVQPSRTRLEC